MRMIFCSQNFVKIFIETIHSTFKKSKVKENYSVHDKRYSQRKLFERNESDEQSRFQQRFEIY